MALEPLAVLSAVCAPDCKDALSLPLHPLLKQVSHAYIIHRLCGLSSRQHKFASHQP